MWSVRAGGPLPPAHIVRAAHGLPSQIEAVRVLREQYPRWSKDKLHTVLKREGIVISASMIGRILADLKVRGVLREPPSVRKMRRRSSARPHARRKPKDWVVSQPGDLVQIDTKDVRPVPGKVFKHLSLVDVMGRYAVAEIGVGATAKTTKERLERMLDRLPFSVRGAADRWRRRVQRCLRGVLPGAQGRSVCPAAAISKTERRRRKNSAHL